MKVSLLTVIVVGVLPSQVVAQPGYLRTGTQPTRVYQAQQAETAHTRPAPGARIEPEYRFPISISITATGFHNGEKRERNVLTYYVNPSHGWVATASGCEERSLKAGDCAGQHILHIYDKDAATMLVVNMRAKRGISMSMPVVAATTAERRRQEKLPPPGENGCRCDKTGKRKTIDGFRTEEWACVSPSRDTRFVMWVTSELPDFAAPGTGTELSGFMHRAARVGGVPLEGYYYLNGDLKSSLKLTGVNRAAQFSVNTAEYRLTGGR